jgi:hypothetical protein
VTHACHQFTGVGARVGGEQVLSVARALIDMYKPLKMNYETLGNSLPHLHTHLIPGFTDDSHSRCPRNSQMRKSRRTNFGQTPGLSADSSTKTEQSELRSWVGPWAIARRRNLISLTRFFWPLGGPS